MPGSDAPNHRVFADYEREVELRIPEGSMIVERGGIPAPWQDLTDLEIVTLANGFEVLLRALRDRPRTV